jgi:hypothetical protein
LLYPAACSCKAADRSLIDSRGKKDWFFYRQDPGLLILMR